MATESSGDTIELEFKQAELARAETVLNLIETRTMQLRTERRAPERVELLARATPPSAPLEQVPYKRIAVASLAGFCLPFLCSGLVFAVIVMRRQRQQILPGIHVGRSGEATIDVTLREVLQQLAQHFEDTLGTSIDVQRVVSAIIIACREGKLNRKSRLTAIDPSLRTIIEEQLRLAMERDRTSVS